MQRASRAGVYYTIRYSIVVDSIHSCFSSCVNLHECPYSIVYIKGGLRQGQGGVRRGEESEDDEKVRPQASKAASMRTVRRPVKSLVCMEACMSPALTHADL